MCCSLAALLSWHEVSTIAAQQMPNVGKVEFENGSITVLRIHMAPHENHRGKVQQKVTVEHVHLHDGGQAIVGTVENRGEG